MSASFRSILQQVTQEKLEELQVQQNLMSSHFKPVLEQAQDTSKNPVQVLTALYEALRDSPVEDSFDQILIDNLKYVLQNAKDDPSLSSQLVLIWIEKLKQEIKYALRKCEYSFLYGSLLTEWLESEERKAGKQQGPAPTPGQEGGADMTSPQQDEKAKLDKQKSLDILRKLMFTAPSQEEFETEKFKKFLTEELFVFGEEYESKKIIEEIQKETKDFFNPVDYVISSGDVKACISGLSSEELLSPEKKAALKELNENTEALEEVATLLTSRLRNLQRWQWPSTGGSDVVDLRRGLAGEYKAFLNEDIITALFLQYVGVQWASYFKRQFMTIYSNKTWIKEDCFPNSIEQQRRQFHQQAFLSLLPDSMYSQDSQHQEEYARIESHIMQDYAAPMSAMMMEGQQQQQALFGSAPAVGFAGGAHPPMMNRSMKAKRMAPAPPPPPKQDIDFKQQFLHILSTEIRLNQVVRPEKPLVVVQADLESFGPSVIHEAALISLEYLGVPPMWLEFMKKFLQPKVRLTEGDEPQSVLRGVPTSHALSNLFGETLMFFLEFLINRKFKGMRLFRIKDEFWYWSPEAEIATRAWDTIQSYGKMVGLKINENRSGSVAVYAEGKVPGGNENNEKIVCGPLPLPQRNIHWGYLQLHSNGTFQIDRNAITKFLDEMKGLLERSDCTLEWINIFNKYLAFFVRNFGKCAFVSGKQHLDQIVSALKMIYTGLFGSETGNPVGTLKAKFQRLQKADIVDVWVYWPLERGGLGLVNPFISIMALRETFVDNNDEDHFKNLPLKDKQVWEEMKKEHERHYGGIEPPMIMGRASGPTPVMVNPGFRPPKFPTWEEYLAKRETELSHWLDRYNALLERPSPKDPKVSEKYWSLEGRTADEDRNYTMWLFSYYETQLILHFGSVKFINSKLLPMSMIANIQKSKVKH